MSKTEERKIRDQMTLQLVEAGIPTRQIANAFHVTPTRIREIVRREQARAEGHEHEHEAEAEAA